jgi:aconitate decarboxylase
LNLADRDSADSFEANGKGVDDDGKWEVEKNTFKPFPCGIVIHPAIDGCAQLRSEGLDVASIESVQLSVHPLVLELTGKKFPKDGLEAKFSVYHGAACGFLFGKASPAEYTDEVVQRTATLREKITATVDGDIEPDECRIVVDSSSGRHEKHVKHAIGSLAKPLTLEHLRQKFVDQVEPLVGKADVSKLFEDLTGMLEVKSVSTLVVT